MEVKLWQKEVIAFIVRNVISNYKNSFFNTLNRCIDGEGSLAWSRITGCGPPASQMAVLRRQTPVDPSSNALKTGEFSLAFRLESLGPRPLMITGGKANG